MIYARAAAILAVLAALAAAAWGVHHWDAGRQRASYEAGELAERGRWEQAKANAVDKAASRAQAATLTAEQAGDTAKAQTAASGALAAKQTQSTVESITHAYIAENPPVCVPDGRPVPLPAGVLKGLDEARSAAVGHP